MLAHDGEGSDLNETIVDADFIVRELQNPDQTNVVRRTIIEEYEISSSQVTSTDVNNDGVTNLSDLSVFMSGLNREYLEENDFNGDGKVNLKDLSIMMSNILR